jgi:hypothetical protein
MPYAYHYDVPADADMYRRVAAEIGDVSPAGLICHLVVEHDGGLRHFGVWETKEQWEHFRDEHVQPAVGRVLAAAGIPASPPPPVEQEMAVVDVITGNVRV